MIKLAKQHQKVDCVIMDPLAVEVLKSLWIQLKS